MGSQADMLSVESAVSALRRSSLGQVCAWGRSGVDAEAGMTRRLCVAR